MTTFLAYLAFSLIASKSLNYLSVWTFPKLTPSNYGLLAEPPVAINNLS